MTGSFRREPRVSHRVSAGDHTVVEHCRHGLDWLVKQLDKTKVIDS